MVLTDNTVWSTLDTGLTPKQVAISFAQYYWPEPRKIRGWKPDGTFTLVQGVRRYRVLLHPATRTESAAYTVEIFQKTG